ncbi:hypothetical protein KAJ27_09435 [bacterium]|nr:hypothetical protein [bacterium]
MSRFLIRKNRKFIIFFAIFFLCNILMAGKWEISEGKFTSGLNLNTGNVLTNFKPGINFDLLKYTKSAKYAVAEGNIVQGSGQTGGWSYGGSVDHFTGVRVNGYGSLGGTVTFDEAYDKQNQAVAKEDAKSTGIQKIKGAAYDDGLKSKVTDANGNIAEIPGTAILREGNTKFGWQHISYDRPDGTNHAKELASVYNLPDADKSVVDLIIYTIETGDKELQVREKNGEAQQRWIYTKVIDGKPMKVVVDGPGSKYEGSIITAYPTKYKRDKDSNNDSTYNIPSAEKRHSKVKVDSFLGGQAGFSAFGGSEVSSQGYLAYTDSNNIQYMASGRGAVQAGGFAKGRTYLGVKNGKDFVGGANVDLFAGVRASGSLTGGVKIKDIGASVTGLGHIGYGLGVRGNAEFKISWSGISWDVGAEAYLGVGGGMGLKGSIDWGKSLDPVKNGVIKGFDKAKTGVKKVAASIKTGYTNSKDKVKAVTGNLFSAVKSWF